MGRFLSSAAIIMLAVSFGGADARAQYGSYRTTTVGGYGTSSAGSGVGGAYGSYREWRPAGDASAAETLPLPDAATDEAAADEALEAAARTMKAAVKETRHAAGFVAGVVTTVHPVIRAADYVGLIDRRAIVRRIRGD